MPWEGVWAVVHAVAVVVHVRVRAESVPIEVVPLAGISREGVFGVVVVVAVVVVVDGSHPVVGHVQADRSAPSVEELFLSRLLRHRNSDVPEREAVGVDVILAPSWCASGVVSLLRHIGEGDHVGALA